MKDSGKALAVVTGANRGIGLEYCRQLGSRGYAVVALCRQTSRELTDLPGVDIFENADVNNAQVLAKIADKLGPNSVDLLVNNAGILRGTSLDNLDYSSIREQFEVNAIGPLVVTEAFLGCMRNPSKLALMTSRMGSIADNGSGGSYGYRMSKAALNIAGVSLAKDLSERGIAVAILHPGYVRTEMTGGNGYIDTQESVSGLLERIDGLSADNSGTFWHSNGEVLPW